MATTPASEATEGPVLSFINKRLRALRKKQNRILQMEEFIAQGKALNKEQEELLRSKPSVTAAIDELEKLRVPLAAAVADEISLAVQRHQVSVPPPPSVTASESNAKDQNHAETEPIEDLLNLIYFGAMFDLKNQNDFTSIMFTRTHERGCCLTYDYVTDDEVSDLLGERDLDLIAQLGNLLISRPVDSSLSHKNTLQQGIQHAKLWLAKSDQQIDSDPNVTYAGLRAKLNKIMASGYFTATPEIKATVEMAAAAAVNYASFQVPSHESFVPVQVEGLAEEFQQKDEEPADFQAIGTYDSQSSHLDEAPKGEFQQENPMEDLGETEPDKSQEDEQNLRDFDSNEQHHAPRKSYYHQRSGRGGGSGRRGFPNGRGARGSSRGGGPYYPNGRSQYYQDGNFYPKSYYNSRGRGGRGGGVAFYNNHSSGAQANYAAVES